MLNSAQQNGEEKSHASIFSRHVGVLLENDIQFTVLSPYETKQEFENDALNGFQKLKEAELTIVIN